MTTQDSIKVVNGRLLIDVALADVQTAPLSQTGKSKVLYSTRGNIQVDGVSIGLNVYTKAR